MNTSKVKFLVLIIRSLRANFDELLLFLDLFKIKFDEIALTETWIGLEEVGRYLLHGYTSYF